MKTELYTITTLSNMHVGKGDVNFDIIDRQVQRDDITNLPIINSSSLKGAFREHFETIKGEKNNMVNYIFGPGNESNDSHQTGAFSFFEANLLTRPVRSNAKFYFNATSPSIIEKFLNTMEMFSIALDPSLKDALERLASLKPKKNQPLIFEALDDVVLEEFTAVYENFDLGALNQFLGKDLALFDDGDMKELELPVLARNYLKDGVSNNLWYEEVVPKQSKFYFIIVKSSNIDTQDEERIKRFENIFLDQSEKVQFGANKSIGYGFCAVEKVSYE